jgi:uncharacterized protein
MFKLIILIVVGFIVYKMFFNKKIENNTQNTSNDSDELIECSKCHTFVPKNECKWTNSGCLCKDCQ